MRLLGRWAEFRSYDAAAHSMLERLARLSYFMIFGLFYAATHCVNMVIEN